MKLVIDDILYLFLFFGVLRYFFWWVSFILILLKRWVEFFEILFVWFFYSISLMYLEGLLIKVFCFFIGFVLRRIVFVGDKCVICFLILISWFVVICDSNVMDVILFRFWYLKLSVVGVIKVFLLIIIFFLLNLLLSEYLCIFIGECCCVKELRVFFLFMVK